MKRPNEELLRRFMAIVGEKGFLREGHDTKPYLHEWRDLWHGRTALVLRPAETEQVSRILALANATGTAIVPQSGNTGLVGGQIPNSDGSEIVLSLDRMTRIIDVDAADYTLTAQAGATLKSIQDAADAADMLFPLSLASEGSCRIGGNLSTNAGGLNVLAYGNARDLCLGLEVVLADGRVLNGLKKLRKDNTGYDLKNIFIGAEGTLGVITAAVLKLFPKPRRHDTALVAVPSPAAAVELLSRIKGQSGNRVIACELMPEIAMGFTVKHMGVRRVLETPTPWYVLIELADAPPSCLLECFEAGMEHGILTDAVVAQTQAQRAEMWDVREKMPESQRFEGGSIKHDVSVPVSKLPQFIAEASEAVHAHMPDARVMCFGHMGDGNMHFNVTQPIGMDKKAYLDGWHAMSRHVYEVVLKFGGSISAEHGIGQLKRDDMNWIKSPVELELMRGFKRMLDPNGILNPGKVLPD